MYLIRESCIQRKHEGFRSQEYKEEPIPSPVQEPPIRLKKPEKAKRRDTDTEDGDLVYVIPVIVLHVHALTSTYTGTSLLYF